MEATMVLSERLNSRRLELGLTRPQIAKRMGINPTSIEKWESGDNNISPEKRQKVAECYQISESEIEKLCSELKRTKTQNRDARSSLKKRPRRTTTTIGEYSSSEIGDALFQDTGLREVSIRKLHPVSNRGQGGRPKRFFVEKKRITF